jgi:hypothetical protein
MKHKTRYEGTRGGKKADWKRTETELRQEDTDIRGRNKIRNAEYLDKREKNRGQLNVERYIMRMIMIMLFTK